MSCCGQRTPNGPPPRPRPATPPRGPGPDQRVAAVFQYTGRTALSVAGPVTGRIYRFAGPGASERVDLRDRAGLRLVPVLREIS